MKRVLFILIMFLLLLPAARASGNIANSGIIMQQKSIRASVTESTLNSYKSSFKTIIDDLADARDAGTYTLQGGKIITVNDAYFDVVVQKGLDYSSLKAAIENHNDFVKVRFIEK